MNRDDWDDVDEADALPALVDAARRGSGSAQDALYRRFAPVVHGVLLGYVQKADADDLTQDVFETALQRLDQLREAAAFPGWLLGIARHAALDTKRRRAPLTGIEIEAVDVNATHEDRLDAQRSLAAIRGLPEAYRETLMLRLVEGLSGPEIAQRTGLSPGGVRVNLHRGMALLRAALADERTGARAR
ncbi:sigma-70 family RNA polymerase sigma factor [Thermomonas sp. HDW16]|uniref:RNA polymerase sigma factor n=1 Tax=Thermomonas sp. HDW16 TaxID=2714945 RepID=UPI0014073D02|nr:sigma-70 family RNA polymerase sigma factor [Thermomonas sp. HDW16]QIL19862.1 sigma-70 family RNA polymerase sigma factor [Thermomonas sp. HDW16]